MRFIDEFRDAELAKKLVKRIGTYSCEAINIIEVCGTHTMAIFKYGVRDILPKNVKLISGPGCPVCVTPQSYIDAAIEFASMNNVIITTFGDMMRVPGKSGSLLSKRSEGADIRVVYSPMDAIKIAQDNTGKKVIFLSVGFETTTPMTAITAIEAKKSKVNNLFFLTAHKIVPPIMEALVKDKELNIHGFLLPGHVSAIIGSEPYEFLSERYHIPSVITGFEPIDLLHGIDTLLGLIDKKECKVINKYTRIVRTEGNQRAKEQLNQVFDIVDTCWRGLGNVPNSGYVFKKEFEDYDALKHFGIKYKDYDGSPGCRCGEILKGKITPLECPLFKKRCTPEDPIGSCMVSSEGTCAAYFKYHS